MSGQATDEVASRTWRALGTSVQLVTKDAASLDHAQRATSELLERVDAAYSRFRPDSELSRLNAQPARNVTVSPLLADAIEIALRAARFSEGAVDPTVGRTMRLAGYDIDFAGMTTRTEPLTVRLEPAPGWRVVRFDRRRRSVFLPVGVELDLGSTGKALAADLAAAAALAAGSGHGDENHGRASQQREGGVLVGLGGDIALAGRPPAGGWRVLAADDSEDRTDADGEVIALDGGAVATSGTTIRRWTRGGVELHHLIDPSTGRPAESRWRTVSVVASTCVDANVAATGAIVRLDGLEWLEQLGLPARLVSQDGDVVRVGGWPTPQEALA